MAKNFISSLEVDSYTGQVSSLVFMGNVVELLDAQGMLHSHLQEHLVNTGGYGHRYFECTY
jgi:hypothetical protein